MTAKFTPEEDSDLDKFHCLAMDLIRVESQDAGTTPPCWLTLSIEAKDDSIIRLLAYLTKQMGRVVPIGLSSARELANEVVPDRMFSMWREAELSRKQLREDGNLQGYFA